jgi:hypothetical protein
VHDHGIPERSEWPGGVLDALARFRQGDLIRDLPLFYFGDPQRPVHARTLHYQTQGEVESQVVSFSDVAPYGLVLTQTCDLAQEGGGKPNSAWVQLSPVFNALTASPTDPDQHLLSGERRKLIKNGRDQFRLHVPDLPDDGFWFADLTFEVCVERGWFANQECLVGFTKEGEREGVGRRLAWLRARPAFATPFVEAVQQPIISALRIVRREEPARYERMYTRIFEIGIRISSRLAPAQAELFVLHMDATEDLLDWWRNLWVELKLNADEAGFNLLPLNIADLAELPAASYRQLTRLPLAEISPHPAWYGEDPEQFPDPMP